METVRLTDRRGQVDTHGHATTTVVRILALVIAVGAGTMAYLSVREGRMVEGFSEAFTAALGALVGMLARTDNHSDPQDVTVVNEPEQPVPTTMEDGGDA